MINEWYVWEPYRLSFQFCFHFLFTKDTAPLSLLSLNYFLQSWDVFRISNHCTMPARSPAFRPNTTPKNQNRTFVYLLSHLTRESLQEGTKINPPHNAFLFQKTFPHPRHVTPQPHLPLPTLPSPRRSLRPPRPPRPPAPPPHPHPPSPPHPTRRPSPRPRRARPRHSS